MLAQPLVVPLREETMWTPVEGGSVTRFIEIEDILRVEVPSDRPPA